MANYKSTDVVSTYAVGDTVEFDYTGSPEIFKIMNVTNVKIEAYGAQGGGVDNVVAGGFGAYAAGELDYTAIGGKFPEGIIVKVGGTPSKSAVTVGKTNYQIANLPAVIGGGGNGIDNKGCAGGGASDVRAIIADGTPDATDSDSVLSRIIVAGAGAGASYTIDKGIEYDMYEAVSNIEYYQKKYAAYLANPPAAEYEAARWSAFMLPDKWIAVVDGGYVNPFTPWNEFGTIPKVVVGLISAKGANVVLPYSHSDKTYLFNLANYVCLGKFPANTNSKFFSLTSAQYIQSAPFTIYARKEYSAGMKKLITDQAYYFAELDTQRIPNTGNQGSMTIMNIPGRWDSSIRAIQGTIVLDDINIFNTMWSEVDYGNADYPWGLFPAGYWGNQPSARVGFPVAATAEYENGADSQFGEDKIKSGIQGGHGGNFYGSVSSSTSSGATQYNGGTWFGGDPANNGTLEKAGSPTVNFKGGGGGGGYYGGAAGDPATGGNSFAAGDAKCPTTPNPVITLTNTSSSPGVNTGDGKVIFTITGIAAPIPVSPPPPNPKVNHKLCIRKNGVVQKASLYANPIKQPRLAVRNGSVINYAVLSKVKTPGSIDLTVIKNNVKYWVQVTGDPDYIFSLKDKVTRDGNAFRCLPVQYDGYGVPLCYLLGKLTVDQVSTYKVEVDYSYYSNEPRGGTDAVGIVIDLIQNTTSNNLVWTSYQSSQQQNYSFKGTFNITLNPGVYNIAFTGYKPRWHSCESATGTVKLYMI